MDHQSESKIAPDVTASRAMFIVKAVAQWLHLVPFDTPSAPSAIKPR